MNIIINLTNLIIFSPKSVGGNRKVKTSILFNILFFALLFTGLQSCEKGSFEPETIIEQPAMAQAEIAKVDPVNTMVLVYIAANNNLKYEALNSIEKLKEGYTKADGNLLLYVKTDSKLSYLLKINDKRIDTLKSYVNENSSDPNLLKQVIYDSRIYSPARKYGMVMWSHATSWMPPKSGIKLKSFGSDEGRGMDVIELAKALPNDFAYIMFDACYMGTLEVMYELKTKSKYLIASPSEVLSTSFPYELITPYLFGDIQDYIKLCEVYVDFYASKGHYEASATVSLVDTKELNKLAIETKKLSLNLKNRKVNTEFTQRLDFDRNSKMEIFDFFNIIEQNFEAAEISNLKAQLDKTMIYKGNTTKFLAKPIYAYSGLGISFPESGSALIFYKNLSWNKDSNWEAFLN